MLKWIENSKGKYKGKKLAKLQVYKKLIWKI